MREEKSIKALKVITIATILCTTIGITLSIIIYCILQCTGITHEGALCCIAVGLTTVIITVVAWFIVGWLME